MATGDTYKVTMVFSRSATDPSITTGFYVKQDSAVGFDVGDMGDAVKSWWDTELNSSGMATGMKGAYDDDIDLESVTLRKINPLAPVIDVYTTGLPISGSLTDAPLPAQDAPILSLRTGNIGRSYRGRMYLPPVAESEVNQNLTLARADDYAEQAAGLFKAINSSIAYDATVVVWSPTLATSTPVTEVKADIYIRTQRRRTSRPASYSSGAV